MKKYYAVAIGRISGIYNSWEEAKIQVDSYKGEKHSSFTSLNAAGQYITAIQKDMSLKQYYSKKKYYAVRVGLNPGIYESWNAVKQQIDGIRGAQYKCFTSKTKAEIFLKDESVSSKDDTNKYNNNVLVVYTDGSCKNHSNTNNVSVAGIGIWYSDNDERNVSLRLPDNIKQTNNCAEIFAALVVLQSNIDTPLEIKSDSLCLIEGVERYNNYTKYETNKIVDDNNKKKGRIDLLLEINKELNNRQHHCPVIWTYVKSHCGVYGNDRADELASFAIQEC